MYEIISKIVYEKIKDELERKPLTASKLNNPMQKDKKEELYNAIYCYDENDNICGYNIQLRIEENEIYKLRFYIPLIDLNWQNAKAPNDLPDKKIKIGYNGNLISQNELLEANDTDLAKAMYLNFNVYGVNNLGEGFIGIASTDILYLILRRFKFWGYPINEATKKLNENKLFV